MVESKGDDNTLWIRKIVATVSNRPLSDVAIEDKLADLGFDSLMFVELQAAVEDAGGRVAVARHAERGPVGSRTADGRSTRRQIEKAGGRAEGRGEERTRKRSSFPSIVRRVGNAIVDFAQNTLYEGVLDTRIEGESNVPQHVNFIVAPNHTSHIDTGLVKKALGKDVAEQTVAVAAADYWFDTKYKRAYMNNFTTLVPIERTGSLRQSLRHVTQILNEGYNALIFPEGGRQESGQIAEFKPIIGYLALEPKDRDSADLHLGHVRGVSERDDHPAKRSSLGAKIGAKVGRFLEYDELAKMTEGVPNTEAYRLDRGPRAARDREHARRQAR